MNEEEDDDCDDDDGDDADDAEDDAEAELDAEEVEPKGPARYVIEMPADLVRFRLPKGVDERLQNLLDRQAQGEELTTAERLEAEGLVNLAELLSLLRLRVERASREL